MKRRTLVGSLTPGCGLDAARHVDPPRLDDLDRVGDVVGVEPAGEDHAQVGRDVGGRDPSRTACPSPGAGASTSTRSVPYRSARRSSGDVALNALITQRMLLATSAVCSGVSRPWSWTALTPARWAISTTRPGSSSRNTPTVRISGGRRRVMSYTCCGAICRGEGAKMKPTASAPIATANSASSSLVMPQILTNMSSRTVPTARARRRERCAPRTASGWTDRMCTIVERGSAAVTSVSPTRIAS